ncbi:hypothetical protein [Bradyrhizobium huanghuaihaiense]
MMLIAVMVTDKLSEVDGRVLDFLRLKTHHPDVINNPRLKEGHCHFTGERTLYRALCAVLRNEMQPPMVDIEIIRRQKVARLIDCSGYLLSSDFADSPYGYHRSELVHAVRFHDLFSLSQELDFDRGLGPSQDALPVAAGGDPATWASDNFPLGMAQVKSPAQEQLFALRNQYQLAADQNLQRALPSKRGDGDI